MHWVPSECKISPDVASRLDSFPDLVAATDSHSSQATPSVRPQLGASLPNESLNDEDGGNQFPWSLHVPIRTCSHVITDGSANASARSNAMRLWLDMRDPADGLKSGIAASVRWDRDSF